jgi:hypothetical protein|tara:strand:- start:1169 stop:1312 length:144 start_codon:yes stop_codon:yes gene_type:complete
MAQFDHKLDQTMVQEVKKDVAMMSSGETPKSAKLFRAAAAGMLRLLA